MKLSNLLKNITNRLGYSGKKALVLGVMGLFCAGVWGRNLTWNGGSILNDNWNNGANWGGIYSPENADDTANINTTASINLNKNVSFKDLNVTSSGVSINTNGKTFTPTGTSTISNDSALTFTGTGSANLQNLVLGDNANLTVSGGTVSIGNITAGTGSKINVSGGTVKLTQTLPGSPLDDTVLDNLFNVTGGTIDLSGYPGDKTAIVSWAATKGIALAGVDYSLATVSKSASVITIKITRSSNASAEAFPFTVNNYSAQTLTYSVDGGASSTLPATGSFSIVAGTDSSTIDITPSADFANGEGFEIIVTKPDTTALGTVDFFNGPVWIGTSIDGNDISNWKGVTAISDLESADVYINTTANYPAFTADITLGSLHITSGTSITNGTGTLTVAGDIENDGTLTCGAGNLTVQGEYSGSGSFTASSGTTTFLGNTDFSSATAFDANSGTINFFNKAAATGTNITFTTKSGQAFNDVYFGGDVTFSLTGTCTSNNFIQKGPSSEYYLSYNHNATITGSGSLNTGILEIYRVSSTDGVTGTLTLDADVTCTGTFTRLHSGANLTINSGKQLTTVTLDRTGLAPLQKSTLTNNGTITVTNKVDFYNVDEIANNETIEVSGTTVSGVFSGTGTLKIKNSASTTTLTALAASTQKEIVLENSNVTISGDFSVTDFTATSNMSGKTITLSTSKIAVTGTLALEGATGTGNELSISGSAGDGFVLNADKTGGDYLKVDSNIALYSASGTPVTYTKAGYSYTAANSVPSAGTTDGDYVDVIKNGWDIKDKKLLTYKWKVDAASADWSDPDNWEINLVPVTDATIEIQAVTTGTAPSISATAVGGNITIDANATLTFSSAGNLVLSGKAGNIAAAKTVTNNGTIVYQSTGRITDGSNVLNDNTAGTVEYNTGSGTISEIDTTLDYYTLEISSGTWSCAANINAVYLNISGGSISGTFTATTGISTSNTVAISDDTTFTGTTTNSGEIAFASGKILTISGSFDDSGSTSATTGALKFAGTGTFKPNTLTAYSSIEIDATKITTAGNFTTGSLTITAGELDTNDEITITGDFSDSGTFTAGSSSNIILYGTSDQEFVPNASNTYEKITVNKSAGTVSFNTNALNVKTISDATSTGNISFNAGGTISSNTTFATTGDVTFSGATALSFGTYTAEHTAGKTVLKGNVTASTLTVGAVSFEASSTITGDLTLSGGASDAGRVVFDRPSTASGITLTVTGNITSNGYYSLGDARAITLAAGTSTFTNTGDLKIPHSSSITANFANSGTLSAGGSGTDSACKIYGNLTNTGYVIIPSGKYLNVSGTLDDSSGTSWAGTGTLQFTGTTDQAFTNKSGQTYPSVNVKLTAGKTVTVSAPLTITNLTLTSGNITFSDSVTVTNYSETPTPTGNITFNGTTATFTNGATFATTGTVTIAAANTLTTGAGSAFIFNNSKTALSGIISSTKNVSFDSSATLEVQSTSAQISAADITTPAITTNSASNNITLISSTGSFTTGQIGDSTTAFNKVTFDAGTSADLTFANKTLYTTTLDLKVDDSKKLILEGNLNITGTNGFVAPLKTDSTPIPVELSDATTITTSGPVTLYDNITGGQNLTITNTGVFTLNESSTPADPANATSAPATSAAVGIFTQNGAGTVTLAGDISATGNISFAKAITLSDNVKIATSSGSIDFNDGITGSHILITSATDSTNFNSASTANINPTSVDVISGKLTVSTGKIIFNCPVTAEGDFINNIGAETVTHSTLTVKGNFTDSGTFTENTNSEIILSGTTDQNFVPGIVSGTPTTYKKITVNKSAGTVSFITNSLNADYITLTLCDGATFNKPVSMTNGSANLTITNSGTNGTVFKDSVTLNKLTDASTAGNITFEAGGTISSATTFTTTGTVQFGDNAADSITFGANSVTHTTGNTKIAGTLSASEVTAGNLTLLAASTINTTTTNGLKLSGGADADNKNSLTGSFTLTSGGNVSASAFYEINTTKITFFPVTKTLTNNGDLYLASTTITGEISNTDKLIISNDTTLKGSLTNSGTFEIATNKTFQLSTNFTNNGTITANSGSTFEIIKSSASPDKTDISGTGAIAFQKFKADNLGDKTITLKTDVTVNGTLTLKGTDETHLLTIADDQAANANGKGFILSASQPSNISAAAVGDYLSIDTTVKIKKADGTSDGIAGLFYKASNSVPAGTYANAAAENAAYAAVINNGWRIKDLSTLTYTWTGNAAAPANQTDWAARGNWDIGIVPGVTTAGVAQSSDSTVIIPDSLTKYPVINSVEYSVKSLTIGTNGGNKSASITLNGTENLIISTGAATGTLTNYSQIIYSASGRIIGYDGNAINDSVRGSVEYNTATGTMADVTYYDLKITGGNWSNTTNETVAVNHTFTVENTPVISINNGLTCTASTITIPAGTDLTLGGTINSGTNAQTYNCDVKLSADTTFSSPVKTGKADVTFTGNNHKFTFASTLTGTPTAGTPPTYYNIKIDGAVDFYGNVSDSKALILTSNTEIKTNNLKLDVPVEIEDDLTLSGQAVEFKNNISGTGKTLTLTTTASFSGATTITADILNKGTINVPAVADAGTPPAPQTAIAFKGTYTANNSPAGSLVGSGTADPYIDFYKDAIFGDFTANSDTVRFVGTSAQTFTANTQTFYAIEFNNSNGVTLTDTINISNKFTNTSGFTAGSSSTVQITDSAEIHGNSTFQNFSCTTPGKTISFENGKTQTVNGVFTITGASGNNILLRSLSSPNKWNIKCSGPEASSHSIQYADVKDSENTSDYRLNASNSTDSQNNIRWNFITVTYTWKGTTSSNWFIQTNWDKGSVPGIGVNVIIPDSSQYTNPPELTHDLENSHTTYGSIGATGTLTVNAGAQLDLKTYSLTASSITNNGLIKLSGNQTITGATLGSLPIITNGTDSTVEYYGTIPTDAYGNGKSAYGPAYNKLQFTSGANGTISEAITVSQTTEITNGTGNSLTLSGNNTFTGIVTIGNTPVPAGIISITSGENISLADGVVCDSLSVNATGKTITVSGSLSTSAATTLTAATVSTTGGNPGSPVTISATGGLTINGDYSNTGYITNSATTQVNGSITNAQTYTATADTGFTVNFTDTGSWTSSNKLIFNGTGAQQFTSNTATTYADVFINKPSGSSTFTNNVKITTLSDAATAGSITFAGDSLFTNDVNLITAGTVQFGTTAANTTTFGLAAPYSKLTHTAGQTTIYGTVIATEATLGHTNCGTDLLLNINQLNLYGNVTTSASYIKLNGNLTTGYAISIAPNLMLNGSFSGDGQAVFSRNLYIFSPVATPAAVSIGTVTVSGNLIFNRTGAINSTGNIRANNIIIYTGTLTADASSSMEAFSDMLILGANYNLVNTNTGNSQEFIYQQARLSPVNYLRTDFNSTDTAEDKMPDGTLLPTVSTGFSATYTAGSNSILKAGKNFYANGTSFTAASNWFIGLPDITNANNGFAEAAYTSTAFSTIFCNADSSSDGTKARMPAYFCTDNSNNVNWIFDDLEITEVHTERDDVLKLTFNRPVRNLNSELINSISRFRNNSDTYSGFFTDADCKNPLTAVNINSGSIYIKTANSWNTDATGKDAGTENSTDRSGIHKAVIPYVQILTLSGNSAIHISDIWGKRIRNYDGNNRFTDVTDRTGPVLYSVRTGQDFHTQYNKDKGASSQPSFDGHNFIEFRYSEKVNFGDTTLATTENAGKAIFDNSDISKSIWLPAAASIITEDFPDIDNVRVRDSFGVITNDITSTGALNFSGLGTIETGLIHTGTIGNTDKYVNALYRADEYSINLSIAGYTEGTVTDRDGYIYKKWTGYIEQVVQPSGKVSMIDAINTKVTDCALELDGTTPIYNPQERYADRQVIPAINQEYKTELPYENKTVYGDWDISAPVFSPLRLDPDSEWIPGEYYESVGNTSGMGSTLDKIEFHLFDNTPTYSSSDEAAWLTEKGWVQNIKTKNPVLYNEDYSYTADIIGGSRQFADDTERTTGGIRYSTIDSSVVAFKYIDSQLKSAVPNKPFDTTEDGVFIGAKASLFIGSSSQRRAADSADGLYFGLKLTDTDLPVSRSFTVSYDDTKGYITDLAGNRLRSATFKTIDRTPPSYDVFLSPLNQNELYMVFVKKLMITADTIKYRNNNGDQIPINETFESLIPKCFEIFSLDANGKAVISNTLQIDYSVPAKIEEIVSEANEQEFTVIRLKLTGNTTLPAVENMYVRLKYAEGYNEFSQDPITSINDSRVTFIQDSFGNYMPMYQAHCISDFAISSINPLYAYDADMIYNDEIIMNNFYGEGTWAVHDWNEEQQNYGTLPANHPYAIVSDIITGTDRTEDLPAGVRIFLSNNPDSESVSAQYNSDLNQNIRVWFPEISDGLLPAMALKNNPIGNYFQTDSVPLNANESLSRIQFNIPKEVSQAWGPNQQVSFMFGFINADGTPLRIYNSPYYNVGSDSYDLTRDRPLPLYSIRLKDPSDITSLDLWSFKTRAITEQRGGVTILNNVINATVGEKTMVKVNMPSAGKLNVMVMTIDGNIITYLQHGQTEAGEHYYSWDGKNQNKGTVARGMYFIRVVGNGLDETRKVMVVK